MSVIAIDFGTQACRIGAANRGKVNTILNEYNDCQTPTCVSFHEKNRSAATAARQAIVSNFNNTVSNFKRLIGRTFNDEQVQNELAEGFIPCKTVPMEDTDGGGVGLQVQYMNEEQIFSVEQVTAAMFTKLRQIARIAPTTDVGYCVICVPLSFTDVERRRLMDAARIAGLPVTTCLMRETTAAALAYAVSRMNELPKLEEPPKRVLFFNCGYTSTQAVAVELNSSRLRVVGSAAGMAYGGRNFDVRLRDKFAADFKAKYKLDVRANRPAWQRLLDECERVKKQMSMNADELPFTIERFMEDRDVSSKISRKEFEKLIAPDLARIERVLVDAIRHALWQTNDIASVEVFGGSTRVPAVKRVVERVTKQSPGTGLNADEAVAIGGAFYCAMLSSSPTFSATKLWEIFDGTVNDGQQPMDTDQPPPPPPPTEPAAYPNKKSRIDFPIDGSFIPGTLNPKLLQHYIERENEMMMQDKKLRQETADAKNAVEQFLHDVRDRFPVNRMRSIAEFMQTLSDTETWLYGEEGQNAQRSEYTDRLRSLQEADSKASTIARLSPSTTHGTSGKTAAESVPSSSDAVVAARPEMASTLSGCEKEETSREVKKHLARFGATVLLGKTLDLSTTHLLCKYLLDICEINVHSRNIFTDLLREEKVLSSMGHGAMLHPSYVEACQDAKRMISDPAELETRFEWGGEVQVRILREEAAKVLTCDREMFMQRISLVKAATQWRKIIRTTGQHPMSDIVFAVELDSDIAAKCKRVIKAAGGQIVRLFDRKTGAPLALHEKLSLLLIDGSTAESPKLVGRYDELLRAGVHVLDVGFVVQFLSTPYPPTTATPGDAAVFPFNLSDLTYPIVKEKYDAIGYAVRMKPIWRLLLDGGRIDLSVLEQQQPMPPLVRNGSVIDETASTSIKRA